VKSLAEQPALGTIRARLGYSFGPALLYATGGAAYGQVENQVTYRAGGNFGSNSETAELGGYVVGGGIEYSVTPKWSVKAEYQFIDLGNSTVSTITTNSDSISAKSDHAYEIVNFGVAYHIGGTFTPLK